MLYSASENRMMKMMLKLCYTCFGNSGSSAAQGMLYHTHCGCRSLLPQHSQDTLLILCRGKERVTWRGCFQSLACLCESATCPDAHACYACSLVPCKDDKTDCIFFDTKQAHTVMSPCLTKSSTMPLPGEHDTFEWVLRLLRRM